MEQKRELTLEEMDKVSGGLHDREESRRYELDPDYMCPYCRASFRNKDAVKDHIKNAHPQYAQ